jgi:sugar phosphate permease
VDVGKVGPGARSVALGVSWLAYASYYLGRKGFSVAKVAVAGEFGLAAPALGAIDTAFLAAYALGQLPSGLAADRFGARTIASCGLLLSAVACALTGSASGALGLGACFVLNGLAQSTGWPATTRAVAEWTSPRDRGRVMGVWSTCYQVGGVVATALATWLLAHHGWRSVFWLPAGWLAAMGLMVGYALRPGPRAGQLQAPSADPVIAGSLPWRNPVLLSYGTAYFCLKLIRYSLLFWLPFYLHTAAGFDLERSGYLSTSFEVGGALGSVGLGWLSDRMRGRRATAAVGSLLGLAVVLAGYARVGQASALSHCLLLGAVGALLYGPDSLLSGAAAQDEGGSSGSARAVGMVNGMGSAGALLQGALTVGVQRAFGWQALFNVFFGLAILACLCLWPALRARPSPASQAPVIDCDG